ncbi:MAG: patatin-like phospholipase RssA [Thiobacillaceae bacterium]|nr:patatin-like phospholipase RssA [Thiobacillaceae bacterium]
MNASHGPVIGLALGSGSARGWAHIGVLRALDELGVRPDIVCGTSIGALVGAASASDNLDRLEDWVAGLTLQGVVGYFDLSLNGGMIKGAKLIDFFRHHFRDRDIAELPRRFAAVATDLASGREVWLRDGRVLDAVRASIALPGLFTPTSRDGRWLVDGGLVNPVPVSLCRALGAELVIAVDLNADIVGRHLKRSSPPLAGERNPAPDRLAAALMSRIRDTLGELAPAWLEEEKAAEPPSLFDTIATSLNIMQVRISRSRLAGEPPDILITPRLAQLGLLEFHRGREAIAEGRKATQAALPMLRGAGLAG